MNRKNTESTEVMDKSVIIERQRDKMVCGRQNHNWPCCVLFVGYFQSDHGCIFSILGMNGVLSLLFSHVFLLLFFHTILGIIFYVVTSSSMWRFTFFCTISCMYYLVWLECNALSHISNNMNWTEILTTCLKLTN